MRCERRAGSIPLQCEAEAGWKGEMEGEGEHEAVSGKHGGWRHGGMLEESRCFVREALPVLALLLHMALQAFGSREEGWRKGFSWRSDTPNDLAWSSSSSASHDDAVSFSSSSSSSSSFHHFCYSYLDHGWAYIYLRCTWGNKKTVRWGRVFYLTGVVSAAWL